MRLIVAIYFLFLAIAAGVYTGWSETPASIWFGNVAQTVALILAGLNLMATSNLFGRKDAPRKAWTRLTLGVWIWLIGQLMEAYCDLVLHQVAYGTISDAFWVIGYFPMISGTWLLVKNYRSTGLPSGSVRSYAVQFLILAALFAVIFYKIIQPQITDPQRSLVLKLLDFGYPAFDWILIGLGSLLARFAWTMRGGGLARSWILLCLGFMLTAFADILLSNTADFNALAYRLIDVIYFSAYFMIAMAAKTQYDTITRE